VAKRGKYHPFFIFRIGSSFAERKLVEKKARVKRQAKLSSKEREENMQNPAVFWAQVPLEEKRILIFDDVCTTGATLRNLTRYLYSKGVKEISYLSFGREFKKF